MDKTLTDDPVRQTYDLPIMGQRVRECGGRSGWKISRLSAIRGRGDLIAESSLERPDVDCEFYAIGGN